MKKMMIFLLAVVAHFIGACGSNYYQDDGEFSGENNYHESDEVAMSEGSHNAGANCGTCHTPGFRDFAIAGTIYTDSSGTTVAPGKTIIIRDPVGNELMRLTSDALGNFYTNAALSYPIQVESLNGYSMGSSVDDSSRYCNQSGCHDSSRRIY